MKFNALLIEKDDQPYRAAIKVLDDDDLPPGDVTIRVDYSTINYKDGLAITGQAPVVRSFPMVAGTSTWPARWRAASMPRGTPATGWCSTAGGWAKRAAAGWHSAPASTVTGSSPCPRG